MDNPSNSDRSDFSLRAFSHADEQAGGRRDPVETAGFLHEVGKLRKLYVDSVIFANPYWDIILTLFIADHDGRSVSRKTLAAANNISDVRCAGLAIELADRGLIVRPRPEDRYIAISANRRQRMEAFLRSVDRR